MKILQILILTIGLSYIGNAQCYQEIVKGELENSFRSTGYVGTLGKKKLFLEILSTNNGSGTDLNIILIRTDSNIIKDYDICFDITDKTTEITHLTDDESVDTKEYTLSNIKSIVQVLKHSINFGNFTSINTKIYLKDNFLYLDFIEGSCISGCPSYRVKEKYSIENENFKYLNTTKTKIKE